MFLLCQKEAAVASCVYNHESQMGLVEGYDF